MTSQTFNFDSNTVGDTTVTGLTINTDPTITTFGYTVSATQSVSPLNSLKANLYISGSPNSSFYPTSFTGINDQSATVDFYIQTAGAGNTTPFAFVRGNITGSTFLTGSAGSGNTKTIAKSAIDANFPSSGGGGGTTVNNIQILDTGHIVHVLPNQTAGLTIA